MKRVLVTPRSLTHGDHPAFERLRQAGWEIVLGPQGRLPEEAELGDLVQGCVGWIAGVEPVTPKVLAAAKELRVISRNVSGIDNIPLVDAAHLGITVLRANGANAQGVAELTLGLALMAARSIHLTDRGLKEGIWRRSMGTELNGRQVAVVGYGRIGQAVARLFAAFGSVVSVIEPLDVTTEPFARVDLEFAIREAELVTLHCPPSPDGKPLLSIPLLGRVRPGLTLINTARRSLVDEEGLLQQLETGRIAAYCSDVFDQADADAAKLIAHPRVIATAHLGAFTRESVDRAALEAVQNLLAFFENDPPSSHPSEGVATSSRPSENADC
ncbi:MAG: oxidoreductase [Verrucomicrobia bacterium]|nr:oxidoreductase [Verrucomicrobiota bacterium]